MLFERDNPTTARSSYEFRATNSEGPPTKETAAAQANNAIDAWDAPAYSAAHAVLDVHYPDVARFLFENLEANVGVAAVAGVRRFLDRIDLLRDRKKRGRRSATAHGFARP